MFLNSKSFIFLFLIFSFSVFADKHKKVEHVLPEITKEQYAKANESKKPLFLAFNATWCPVCQKQNQVLNSISPEFKKGAEFYTVDWDKKDEFSGPKPAQRTTIAFVKENKIIAELIGETDPEKVKEFIIKSLE